MMKYNLENYHKIISEIISNQESQFGSDAELFSLNNLLKNENIRIKTEIRKTVYRLKSDSKIRHYIHKQQLSLENLIIFVRREINPERRKDLYKISDLNNPENKLKIVYKKLEKLQVFLECDFSVYLSSDRIVPYSSFAKKKKTNRLFVENIRKSKTSAKLSLELLEIICLQNNLKYGRGITYHKFRYNNKFISELSIHLSKHKGIIYDDAIILFLMEMNYNTESFFKFLINKISEDLDKLKTENEQIEFLSHIVKTYKQINIIGNPAYNRNKAHICKQITLWIQHEIKFLSKNQTVTVSNPITPDNPPAKQKLKVNLSVEQLCCFMNFLCQIGLLKPQNNEYLFSFLKENFSTVKTETISLKSISNKFYNIDMATKDAVRAIFIQLFNISK